MKNNLIDNRIIRIFISSTFRDMAAERDYLVTKIFPSLKSYCQKRNVTLTEIDLRWGISEKDSEQGKVAEICLREIENTHPFFIGLLGERYGWTPTRNDMRDNMQVFENFPWIEKDMNQQLSITEMEMRYGVLRSEADINAYFYLRSQQMETSAENRETKGSLEYNKLQKLKSEIRVQERHPVQEYVSIEDLGNKIEEDFKNLVNKLFPEEHLSLLDLERLQQRAFLRSRTGIYIGNEENLKRLDSFLNSESSAFVVTGESGMGKSALIANWIAQQESNKKIIYHFVGNTSIEGDYNKITQRLIDEITDIYQLGDKDQVDSINSLESGDKSTPKEKLEKLLFLIANREELLIILDGINQLEDKDNAKLLNWLPFFPKNVKLIYSTLPDDATMKVFERRGYEIMILEPLKEGQRENLIQNYLGSYGKSLLPQQVEKIANDPESKNTLVLKTLLDELRVFGVHEQINERIDYYLSAKDIPDFFDRVLTRLEEAYNFKDNNFVGEIFSLIAVSRSGLSEDEIMKLTGVAPLYWSQLYCAVTGHTVAKGGLISFSHSFLKEAVWKRYLNDEKAEEKLRERLVSYCEGEMKRGVSDRLYDEYPHQLYKLNDFDKLYQFLVDFDVFRYIDDKDKYELGKYWRALIESNRERYSLGAYLSLDRAGIEEESIAITYNNIGFFISELIADYTLSLEYYFKALKIREEVLGVNNPSTATSYNNIGLVYRSQGDYPTALEYYLKALKIWEEVLGINNPDTATSYNNIGGVYKAMGDYPTALEYYFKALKIREEVLGINNPNTATSYNNIGLVYRSQGDYPKALEYLFKALKIREDILGTNNPDTAASYNNIGGVYDSQGDYPKALEYYLKALKIQEEVLGINNPSTANSYNNIGLVYRSQGDYPKALEYHFKALKIEEEVLGINNPSTAFSYNNIGLVYHSQGDYPTALEYYLKALKIEEEVLGINNPSTAISYNNIGLVYHSQGDYPTALEYYFKALKIEEEVLGINNPDTASSYNNIGTVYNSQGDYPTALEYYFKALKIREEVLGINNPDTANSYNNIGYVYNSQGDYPKALEYYFKALKIQEEVLGINNTSTATSYNNIGAVYDSQGDYPTALEYYFKALKIWEEVLGINNPSTAISYNNIGFVYRSQGDYPTALEYYFKALKIQEEVLGINNPDTAISYSNIGGVYDSQGDYPTALEYYFKALKIREEVWGINNPDTATSYNNIGAVYDSQGDYPKALEYYFKALKFKEEVLGSNNPSTATSYNNIGVVYHSQGDYPKALVYFAKAKAAEE